VRAFFLAVVAVPQLEQPTLSLIEFNRPRTLLVVVSDVIDPTAHRKASHHPGIVGLQQIGRRIHIRHSRIKPQLGSRHY